MDLFLKATTNVPDLVIDYIEVRLKSRKTVSLNWERSNVTCFESDGTTGINAEYFGLCFDEERATGELSDLKDLSVTAVGLYTETHIFADIGISEMTFDDGDETLVVENAYSAKDVSCDG